MHHFVLVYQSIAYIQSNIIWVENISNFTVYMPNKKQKETENV